MTLIIVLKLSFIFPSSFNILAMAALLIGFLFWIFFAFYRQILFLFFFDSLFFFVSYVKPFWLLAPYGFPLIP